MKLTPSQAIIAKDTHRFRVICAGRRLGKALAIDTPILTSNGYKNLIDVKVGDYVFNENGKQVEVLYKSDIYYNRKCYAIKFSDNEIIIADENHDWRVEDKSYRKNLNRSGNVKKIKRTTKELKKNLKYLNNESNYSIELAKLIQTLNKKLLIEPYFIGLWLGDGSNDNCGITTIDKEIIVYLKNYAEKIGRKLRIGGSGKASTYFITGNKTQKARNCSLQSKLRKLNLLKNKHIPKIYLLSSIAQRMELLKGLMDSDGYAGETSNEYTTINKKLAFDFKLLLNSLSIKSTIREYNSKFNGVIIGKKYRISFNTDKKVFRLNRKLKNQNKPIRDWFKRRYIIDINEVNSVPVQCLMVDSDSHLFLAGYGLIATYNTTLAVEEIKGKALYQPSKIAYVATTYAQARDIAWELLKKQLKGIIIRCNESRLELIVRTVGNNESLITLRGWENIETLRGLAFDFMVIDEVAGMRNFWLNWQEIIRPTLTDTKGSVMFISTPKGFNHFYDLYNLENEDKDYKSFKFTSYDNPHLPIDELEKAKQELTEDRFSQEYLADFRKTEGLVYKEFDRMNHLFSDYSDKEFLEIICGIDFGYTNPSCVLKIGVDYDNNYYVLDEWYKVKQTTEQIGSMALSFSSHKVFPDPAEPDRIEILEKMGLNCYEVNKDVILGIDKVRELFKQKRLFIHNNCKNLIWELETYSYPDRKPDRNEEEKPIKENDHACLVGDTLIKLKKGYKKIKDIEIGDIVKTQKGYNKVIDWQLTQKNAEIWKIELNNGYELKGTKDHKIYTKRGKIRLNTLRYDDIIEIDNKLNLSLWKKQLFLINKNIIGMENIIAQWEELRTGEIDYIEKFGNITTEQFQKSIISITKTETRQIMKLIILNLLRVQSIYRIILKRIGKNQNLEKKLETILIELDLLQKSGTLLNKELNGIKNTGKKVGKIEEQLKKFVSNVGKNMKLISLKEQDFAIQIVKRERCEREDVYNITVAEEHNYYANKILVKNCDALRYALISTNIGEMGGKCGFSNTKKRDYS